MEQEDNLSRRSFMELATIVIGGVISLGMAIPAVAYFVGPALQKSQSQDWIRLGSASKVELGTPTLFKARITHQVGWIAEEEEISVYVLTQNGKDFVALSNICTHLGCRVRWISDQSQFFCPCHNAVFNKEGEVIEGPPPRSLDQYQVKVEDDQLFILGG